ncbi:hypothetical protein QQP08_006152 [Theobroma cacao]|nr:hypothetical protein QQP08_006152 [Theobroma cacao]
MRWASFKIPFQEFATRFISTSCESCPKLSGIVPFIILYDRSNFLSAGKLPIDDGIEPQKELPERFANSAGIEPLKKSHVRYSSVRSVRLNNHWGTTELKEFSDKSRTESEVKLMDGNDNGRPLSSHQCKRKSTKEGSILNICSQFSPMLSSLVNPRFRYFKEERSESHFRLPERSSLRPVLLYESA